MEILGYLSSLLIGVTLGLIGSGGSILTVPVLVYLFGVEVVAATSYSLFIVGLTSAVGSLQYFRSGLVNIRSAVFFGIPSIVAVYISRAMIVPAIPDDVITIDSFTLTKRLFLLLLFAVLMIFAAVQMINNKKTNATENPQLPRHYAYILAEGAVVGILTGLVGAGGGFLIIPALVLLGGLPMKEAIGTSLVIIALKSLIGFLGEGNLAGMDWTLIIAISAFALIGVWLGLLLARKIDGARLKPAFGWFVLFMGFFIIVKEFLVK
jgi:uncharacterized membrane protein YfcA